MHSAEMQGGGSREGRVVLRGNGVVAYTGRGGSAAGRCTLSARGADVEFDVSIQAFALVSTVIVGVAGTVCVALRRVDRLSGGIVGAPARLPLHNGIGVAVDASVVAGAVGLVDVGDWSLLAERRRPLEALLTSVVVGAGVLTRAVDLAQSMRMLPEARHESEQHERPAASTASCLPCHFECGAKLLA